MNTSIQFSRSGKDRVHRFSFNGKENDNEVKGIGNQQDYGFRIYDTRISRFLSVDPLSRQYPELTPYQFASDSPIENIDIDGLEGHPAGKDNADNKTLQEKAITWIGGVGSSILNDFSTAMSYFTDPETEVTPAEATFASLSIASIYVIPEAMEARATKTVINVEKAETVLAKAEANATSLVEKAEAKVAKKVKSKTSGQDSPSKVQYSKTTAPVGKSNFSKTTEVKPSNKKPGQSRAEYIRFKNSEGKVIKSVKDSYDRAGYFMHRKPKPLPKGN